MSAIPPNAGSWSSPSHSHTHNHCLPGHTHSVGEPNLFNKIADADIVLAFNCRNALLEVLKHHGGTILEPVKVEYAISEFSTIISRMLFGDNDLVMFQEGLSGEIKNAIEDTIKKFHR